MLLSNSIDKQKNINPIDAPDGSIKDGVNAFKHLLFKPHGDYFVKKYCN